MGYDSWENIGYQVIDKLNRFDTTLQNIEESLKKNEAKMATMDAKIWGVCIFVGIVGFAVSRFLGV
jgi:hypothetical protein